MLALHYGDAPYAYDSGAMRPAVLDLIDEARREAEMLNVLPHNDPVPQQAQKRVDRSTHRGWRLYHEQTQEVIALPVGAAVALEKFMDRFCDIAPTRSGTKEHAHLKKNAGTILADRSGNPSPENH